MSPCLHASDLKPLFQPWSPLLLLVAIIRSGLLAQAEKQLSEMHKEKAAWLKTQKAQQIQVNPNY